MFLVVLAASWVGLTAIIAVVTCLSPQQYTSREYRLRNLPFKATVIMILQKKNFKGYTAFCSQVIDFLSKLIVAS